MSDATTPPTTSPAAPAPAAAAAAPVAATTAVTNDESAKSSAAGTSDEAAKSSVTSRPFGRRCALVVVDVQNDYVLVDGAMTQANADAIKVTIVNLKQGVAWDAVAFSQEWHPVGHCSFVSTHLSAGRNVTKFNAEGESLMWPDHCVQHTKGAELALELSSSDLIVQKGMSVDVPSFSAFFDGDGMTKTSLTKLLRKACVTDVYVVGTGIDYTAGNTAMDAVKEGFQSFLVVDAVSAIDDTKIKASRVSLEQGGVCLVSSEVVLQQMGRVEDRQQNAVQYMEQHDISTLLQKLCTSLVYEKPDDPRAFLVFEIGRMQREKESADGMSRLSLITDEDLETMFNMLDPVGHGVLQGRQVVRALNGLGLKPSEEVADDAAFELAAFKSLVQKAT